MDLPQVYKDPQKHNRNSKSMSGLLSASWHRHVVRLRGKRAARRPCVARALQLPAALQRASAPGGAVAHALRCTPRMPQADEKRTEHARGHAGRHAGRATRRSAALRARGSPAMDTEEPRGEAGAALRAPGRRKTIPLLSVDLSLAEQPVTNF